MLFGERYNTNRYLIVLYNVLALHLFLSIYSAQKTFGQGVCDLSRSTTLLMNTNDRHFYTLTGVLCVWMDDFLLILHLNQFIQNIGVGRG